MEDQNYSFNLDSMYCSQAESSKEENTSNKPERFMRINSVKSVNELLGKIHEEVLDHFEAKKLLGNVQVMCYLKMISKLNFKTYKHKYFAEKIKNSLKKIYSLNESFQNTISLNGTTNSQKPVSYLYDTQEVETKKVNNVDVWKLPIKFSTEYSSFNSEMLSNKNFIENSSRGKHEYKTLDKDLFTRDFEFSVHNTVPGLMSQTNDAPCKYNSELHNETTSSKESFSDFIVINANEKHSNSSSLNFSENTGYAVEHDIISETNSKEKTGCISTSGTMNSDETDLLSGTPQDIILPRGNARNFFKEPFPKKLRTETFSPYTKARNKTPVGNPSIEFNKTPPKVTNDRFCTRNPQKSVTGNDRIEQQHLTVSLTASPMIVDESYSDVLSENSCSTKIEKASGSVIAESQMVHQETLAETISLLPNCATADTLSVINVANSFLTRISNDVERGRSNTTASEKDSLETSTRSKFSEGSNFLENHDSINSSLKKPSWRKSILNNNEPNSSTLKRQSFETSNKKQIISESELESDSVSTKTLNKFTPVCTDVNVIVNDLAMTKDASKNWSTLLKEIDTRISHPNASVVKNLVVELKSDEKIDNKENIRKTLKLEHQASSIIRQQFGNCAADIVNGSKSFLPIHDELECTENIVDKVTDSLSKLIERISLEETYNAEERLSWPTCEFEGFSFEDKQKLSSWVKMLRSYLSQIEKIGEYMAFNEWNIPNCDGDTTSEGTEEIFKDWNKQII